MKDTDDRIVHLIQYSQTSRSLWLWGPSYLQGRASHSKSKLPLTSQHPVTLTRGLHKMEPYKCLLSAAGIWCKFNWWAGPANLAAHLPTVGACHTPGRPRLCPPRRSAAKCQQLRACLCFPCCTMQLLCLATTEAHGRSPYEPLPISLCYCIVPMPC